MAISVNFCALRLLLAPQTYPNVLPLSLELTPEDSLRTLKLPENSVCKQWHTNSTTTGEPCTIMIVLCSCTVTRCFMHGLAAPRPFQMVISPASVPVRMRRPWTSGWLVTVERVRKPFLGFW